MVLRHIALTAPAKVNKQRLPLTNGEPAREVHDNGLSAPLRLALTASALGPVSVVARARTLPARLPQKRSFPASP